MEKFIRPQSAKPENKETESKSSRQLDRTLETKSIMEPSSPHKDYLTSSEDRVSQSVIKARPMSAKASFGIQGYQVPKSLHQYNGPSYSIKKDKSNCFDMETKEQRNNPAPGSYEIRKFLTKEEEHEMERARRSKIDRSKLPKRPMFMDQEIQRGKGVPAPGQYSPKRLKPTIGNVAMKLDRISYLDEAIMNGENSMGPGQY